MIVPVHPDVEQDRKPPMILRPETTLAAVWLAGQMEQARVVARWVTGPRAQQIFADCCRPAGLYAKGAL